MPADPKIYDSARLAESYARFRPPVHPAVAQRIRNALIGSEKFDSVMDAGCGGGASTAAMLPHADHVVGLDPFPQMLAHAAKAVPGARFVQGRIERLPFDTAAFQLVTSAGAINYTEPAVALPELARVLRPGGWLALYDFSAGLRLARPSSLPERFAQLRAVFPPPGGYALNLAALPFAEAGLSLAMDCSFELDVPMTARQYIDYIMGEAGVEAAIAGGVNPSDARQTCEQLFASVFAAPSEVLVFDVVLAIAERDLAKATGQRQLGNGS